LPIVSASVGPARPRQNSVLAAKVARVVGMDREAPGLAAAEEFLNDAIIEFNTKLYEANKIGPTSVTLTGGTGTLPALFYKELECQQVGSAGNKVRQLNYIDWAEYQHLTFDTEWTTLTSPMYYTLFNTYRTGQIKTLPAGGATGTVYVKITYYKRIPLLAGNVDILDMPQEIERALVLKAQSQMIRTYRSADPSAWMPWEVLAEAAWARFVTIDTKHVDMKPRFRLPPMTARYYNEV